MNLQDVLENVAENLQAVSPLKDGEICFLYTHGGLKPVKIILPVPTVTSPKDLFECEVIIGKSRKSSLHQGENHVISRLVRPTLINDYLMELLESGTLFSELFKTLSPQDFSQNIQNSTWGVVGFWYWYQLTLENCIRTCQNMFDRRIQENTVQSVFCTEISRLINRYEVISGSHHLDFHKKSLELGYLGLDQSNPRFQVKVMPDYYTAGKTPFIQKALSLGFSPIFTGKGSPGVRLIDPKLEFQQLCIYTEADPSKRVPRESYSGIPQAQRFTSSMFSKSNVQSVAGPPIFLERGNRIKYLNIGIMSPHTLVPISEDRGSINTDAFLSTRFVKELGLLGTIREKTDTVADDGVKTEHDVLAEYADKEDPAITQEYTPCGGGWVSNYCISYTQRSSSHNLSKILIAGTGGKGMIYPIDLYLVEKRPNEDFYRPIHIIVPQETILKKQMATVVLRMLLSRTNKLEVVEDVKRSEIPQEFQRVKSLLKEKGDSGYSRIFIFEPSCGKDSREIEVLGFNFSDPLSTKEDEFYQASGVLKDICSGDSESSSSTFSTITGESGIIRLPDDQHYGNLSRRGSSCISLDKLVRIANPEIEEPKDKTNLQVLRIYQSLIQHYPKRDSDIEFED